MALLRAFTSRFALTRPTPDLDGSTLNSREMTIFNCYVFDPKHMDLRAALNAFKNEVNEIILARQSFGHVSSLQANVWSLYFREVLERSPSSTFVKGVLETFRNDDMSGNIPTDREVESRLFHFASRLDAKAAAERAKAAGARSRQPHAHADKPTPKDTGRAAAGTKPGPPKDQRPGTLKRANFTGRPVLASDLPESADRLVLYLGNCFKCGAKGHRSSECANLPACALCAGVEAPKSNTTNDCPRLSDQKTRKPGSAGRAYREGTGWTQSVSG